VKPVEADERPAYTGVMTSCLSRISRLRARRSRRNEPVASDGARPDRPIDPTRPAPVRIEDGVPIAHAGPPGFPGAPLPVEDEAER
jgi:hypothetical protein